MDKSKLYYLVQKGTNIQATTANKKAVMVDEDAIDEVAKVWSKYEKITIEEYENRYEVRTGD